MDHDAAGPLAEYSALRQEVTARLSFMHQILGFHLTVTGSIIAFSLSAPGRACLLLIVPWISFVLAGRYVSQEYGIDRIGEYNRTSLSGMIPGSLGWEQWMMDNPRQLSMLGWFVPLMVAFPGASIFALTWTGQRLVTSHPGPSVIWILLWSGGLIMTGLAIRAVIWVPRYRRSALMATVSLDPARSVAAVVFDLDGLMIDSERVERSAWQAAASEFGCTITDQDFAAILGATAAERKNLLTRLWSDRSENASAFDAIATRKTELVQQEAIAPKPGLTSLISWAKVLLPLAIASSTHSDLLFSRLLAAGVDPGQFTVIVTGDDVQKPKPSAEIYWLAARRLGVPAHCCLVLEDSDNGIRAAHAAGTIPILVVDPSLRAGNPPPADIAAMAYQLFVSLADAEAYLRGKVRTHSRKLPVRPTWYRHDDHRAGTASRTQPCQNG